VSLDFTKEQVLGAIKGSMGIVSKIAHALGGCDWHTAQRYVQRWAETRAAYADESERALDLSESMLLKAVQAGDGPMIRFHLATKGKQRGYTERTEVVGVEGAPLEVRHGFTDNAVADILSILAEAGAIPASAEDSGDAEAQ
jgi:hypothetical protein